MNGFVRTLRRYAEDARTAFREAPVEVLLGVAVAAAASWAIESSLPSDDEWETFARVAASAALAFPLVLALSASFARGLVSSAVRWGGTAGVVLTAAAYGAWVVDPDLESEAWRWFALTFAALLALMLVPVPPRGGREEARARFWRFNLRLGVRVAGVAAYAGLLWVMLAGAMAAVDNLFDLGLRDEAYGHLAAWIFFALAPWILVGGLPRLLAPPEPGEGVPVWASRIGTFLYLPLVVVYLTILYAYTIKVVVTGDAPRNLVSPLVLLAGGVGFAGSVWLGGVHDDEEHRGLSRVVRLFPLLLLPLLPLAFWAVGVRIGQYGWTEFRWLRMAVLVAFAVLGVLGTLRLVRRRPPLLAAIPATLAVALLLGAAGPWGAPAVSERSQRERLVTGLRGAGLEGPAQWRSLLDTTRADTLVLDSATYGRVVGSARYLFDAHGPEALEPVFGALPDSVDYGWDLVRRLAVKEDPCARRFVPRPVPWMLPVGEDGVPVIAGRMWRFDLARGDGTAADVAMMERPTTAMGDAAIVAADGRLARGDVTVTLVAGVVAVEAGGVRRTLDLGARVVAPTGRAEVCANEQATREWLRAPTPAEAVIDLPGGGGTPAARVVVTGVRPEVETRPAAGDTTEVDMPVAVGIEGVEGLLIVP